MNCQLQTIETLKMRIDLAEKVPEGVKILFLSQMSDEEIETNHKAFYELLEGLQTDGATDEVLTGLAKEKLLEPVFNAVMPF